MGLKQNCLSDVLDISVVNGFPVVTTRAPEGKHNRQVTGHTEIVTGKRVFQRKALFQCTSYSVISVSLW